MAQRSAKQLGADLIKAMNEVLAHVRGEIELPSRVVRVPDSIDVRKIRRRLGLTQAKFAARFGFSVAAVRDWEQGRRKPEKAARVLLTIIAKEPKAVDRALRAA